MTMKTKRIASLLLSAALLLSLAVPAFAENPTTEETAEPETAVQEVEPEALTEDDAVAPVAEPTAKKEYIFNALLKSSTAYQKSECNDYRKPYNHLNRRCHKVVKHSRNLF